MVTFSQLQKKQKRVVKKQKCKTKDLKQCPQKKAVCVKLMIRSPKKPHSARRKTMRVIIPSTGKYVMCYITGAGHSLQKYSTFLIRGGRRRDIPGMKYTAIRSKNSDFSILASCRKARSKYGVPRFL